jgi:phage shock protein C
MKRLYRSRESSIIGGVCGGLGEYFNLDPVIVRIVFLVFIFAYFTGPLTYIICWIIMPLRPQGEVAEVSANTTVDRSEFYRYMPGLLLIIIGAAFLMGRIWDWVSFTHLWPLIIIVVGAFLIYKAIGQKKENQDDGR